jgi:hypothetical protein
LGANEVHEDCPTAEAFQPIVALACQKGYFREFRKRLAFSKLAKISFRQAKAAIG